jgi:hypothetical protein
MGDIEMIKGVLLAWKLCSKGGLVNGVVGLLGCVGLGDYVGTGIGIHRERRGGRNNKYTTNICNTKHAMLTCSAGLPKSMYRSF